MKKIVVLLSLLSGILSAPSFAEELYSEGITVLNETTFIRISEVTNGLETIQLFKIENDRIRLVDAVQIREKNINFKPLLEYVRLKIEEEDSF